MLPMPSSLLKREPIFWFWFLLTSNRETVSYHEWSMNDALSLWTWFKMDLLWDRRWPGFYSVGKHVLLPKLTLSWLNQRSILMELCIWLKIFLLLSTMRLSHTHQFSFHRFCMCSSVVFWVMTSLQYVFCLLQRIFDILELLSLLNLFTLRRLDSFLAKTDDGDVI